MGMMNTQHLLPVMNDLFVDQPASAPQRFINLQGPSDLAGFRSAARRLLAQQVRPESVSWHSSHDSMRDLFAVAGEGDAGVRLDGAPLDAPEASDSPDSSDSPALSAAPAIGVPAEFLQLCQTVILHSAAHRFGLLYRLLWRLQHEPALRRDPLDADWIEAQHLAQAVRRDMHKMKAFVRFRTVQDEAFKTRPEGGPLHVAWFEPEHHIVEAIAPFFARRFTQMRWAILTPECSVDWDGASLRFGPGALKADAPPADAGELLWLTYYQNIFNPARLKLKMMQKEMPRRYWKNLPEATFISGMAAEATRRSADMVDQPPSTPRRRIPVVQAATTAGAAQSPVFLIQPLSLPALNRATQHCRDCPIGEHATQAVSGEGPVGARLMLVGEQPGDQEDLRGRPFVGPAGQLLDRAFKDLGWLRPSLYLTNAVKHFKFEPRGKRRIHKTPAQKEIAACRQWLESEIELVKPEAVVALGATAAAALLGRPVAVMSERGQWFVRDDGLPVLVTLHPAALLRADPEQHADTYRAWLEDLRKADKLPVRQQAVTVA